MSIKRNNKQIAGNYVNINMELFTQQYAQMIQELNDLYEATKQVSYDIGSPIGSEKIWRGQTIPEDYLEMNGQEVLRTEYNELYDWVVANNLIISEYESKVNGAISQKKAGALCDVVRHSKKRPCRYSILTICRLN